MRVGANFCQSNGLLLGLLLPAMVGAVSLVQFGWEIWGSNPNALPKHLHLSKYTVDGRIHQGWRKTEKFSPFSARVSLFPLAGNIGN